MEESASAEEANALIINVNEHQHIILANDITKLLESSEVLLSPECCIHRVPHDLRKLNEEAYTLQFISIGPFHHGDKGLKIMEKLKVRYFKRFVQKAALNVENLVSNIRVREGDVRRCYAETSKLNSDNYVQMILLDASFIFVLFLTFELGEWRRDDDVTILTQRLIDDICLLENQLPFFLLFKNYTTLHLHLAQTTLPSLSLPLNFFAYYNTQKMSIDPYLEINHFVDLFRTFFWPQSQRLQQINRGEKVTHLYGASQLHEAGVKLKVGSSECLFDLKFTNGVFEIPQLKLYDATESFFRNLMAFEQFHYPFDRYVTDYFRILDFLIDTTKDVDLLVRKGILVNGLGESNAVTTLVNSFCTQIFVSNTNSDYCNLCKDLNTLYEDSRHSWKATLRRDYFSTPWRTASAITASIFFVAHFHTNCMLYHLIIVDMKSV